MLAFDEGLLDDVGFFLRADDLLKLLGRLERLLGEPFDWKLSGRLDRRFGEEGPLDLEGDRGAPPVSGGRDCLTPPELEKIALYARGLLCSSPLVH